MVNNRISSVMLGIFLFMTGPSQVSFWEMITSPQLSAQTMRLPNREYVITIKGDLSDNKLITKLDPREVRMKFGKGAECRRVSLKSLGWILEPEKCYEAEDTLKPGDSTTIHFKEIGLFNYEIEYVYDNRIEKGIVRVQSEHR